MDAIWPAAPPSRPAAPPLPARPPWGTARSPPGSRRPLPRRGRRSAAPTGPISHLTPTTRWADSATRSPGSPPLSTAAMSTSEEDRASLATIAMSAAAAMAVTSAVLRDERPDPAVLDLRAGRLVGLGARGRRAHEQLADPLTRGHAGHHRVGHLVAGTEELRLCARTGRGDRGHPHGHNRQTDRGGETLTADSSSHASRA